jgi:hypothetical protein
MRSRLRLRLELSVVRPSSLVFVAMRTKIDRVAVGIAQQCGGTAVGSGDERLFEDEAGGSSALRDVGDLSVAEN